VKISDMQFRMILHELFAIVGSEYVITSKADRTIYGVDYYWAPRLMIDRGKLPPLSDVIVQPANVEQVSAVVKLANIYHIPVIPWGGGSGSQGGIMPMYGGIMLDLKRLNQIIEINDISGTVTAQAYPASVHSATLGGYLACRGSGTVSTKYGKAEDMVLSMQVVLPTGEIIQTLPVPNHAAGPGILQLFVGAEGSYGIITKATMRLERLPEVRRFRSFLFPDMHAGLEAGRNIMLDRLQPLVIRLYDERSTIKTVRRVLNLDVNHGAYMVIRRLYGDRI
jgi:alkyldihydroxyacetonephosphate synthase